MNRFNKIFVVTLFNYATGGVELCHQLVDYLRRRGVDAYIVYMKDNKISENQTVTEAYKCYDVKSSSMIEDEENNLLVLPEVFFDLMYDYNRMKIGCWWMSVDNRYSNASLMDKLMFKPSVTKWYKLLTRYVKYPERRNKNSIRDFKRQNSRLYHFYQSCYAQMHLYSKGLEKVIPLTDYINVDFVKHENAEKTDIVLYNPSKGYKFTKKVMAKLPDVKFVPLRNLDRQQLSELLVKAKLYIDFGHFPGKDRLPREAVISGCCVITGTEGASFFYEDMPIDSKYKIKQSLSNIPAIADRIKYVLAHYDECKGDFDYYRSQVLSEKDRFIREIESFFFISK